TRRAIVASMPDARTMSETWPVLRRLLLVVLPATLVVAAVYVAYRLIDPLPPRHFAIAAGLAGSTYDAFARRYARILPREGVELEIRNTGGALEDLDLLRDARSGVQAALTTIGFARPGDADDVYSLGGVFDAHIFIFYRNSEPLTQIAQLRGKRIAV